MQERNTRKSYADKLKDPRWQKRRLEVLNAANWHCEDAGCRRSDNSLEVHHTYYSRGLEPWDYPRQALIALCDQCHERRQSIECSIKVSLMQALRDVPIRRLETVAWKLVSESLKECEASGAH